MKITARKAAPDQFVLRFEETEVTLTSGDLKTLLLQITRLLAPAEDVLRSAEDRAKEFLTRLKGANNVGLQKFIMLAPHDDLLVLLKSAEADQDALQKFYANMSDRSRKIVAEDLVYKFKEAVPATQLTLALGRLTRLAKDLEGEGTLVIEGAPKR